MANWNAAAFAVIPLADTTLGHYQIPCQVENLSYDPDSCGMFGKWQILLIACVSLCRPGLPLQAASTNQWTAWRALPQVDPYPGIEAIAFGDGKYVAICGNGIIATSPDRTNWTFQASATTNALATVSYVNGEFVALGVAGTLVTSPDGIHWTNRVSGTYNALRGVAYGMGNYVVVGGDSVGETVILTSPDSIKWTSQVFSTGSPLNRVLYADERFVAVGGDGAILTSPDGIHWTNRASGTTNPLDGLAYNGQIFVSVGDKGAIVTSPDGIQWSSPTNGPASGFTDLAYGKGLLVAVGWSGTAEVSADGVRWSISDTGLTTGLNTVTFAQAYFVAAGVGGIICQSASLTQPPVIQSPLLWPVSALPDGDLQITLQGSKGISYDIQSSTNLLSWTNLTNVLSTNPAMPFDVPLPGFSERAFYRALATP